MAEKRKSKRPAVRRQTTLRDQAEARLRASRTEIASMSKQNIQASVHELQVHQVELEMQNEELRLAQLELAESRDRYSYLYDFAPVGYITVNREGRILEANLTAATMLGAERQVLLRGNLSTFVARNDQDNWHLHRQAVFFSETQQSCELSMRKKDGTPWFVRLESIAVGGQPDRRCHIALIDITARKQAEQLLAEAIRQKEVLYQLVEHRQRAKSLEEIYDATLDAILSALRCDRVSILLCDDSGVMRFIAWRGLSDGYRKATEGHSPWKNDEPNPQPVCVPDVAGSDLDASLKAVVTGEGIGALAFIPLMVNKRLAGKFMIYYNSPHAFGGPELQLCLTIAGQLALGIERMRTEQALRESEERFRMLVGVITDVPWTTDALGAFVTLQSKWADYTGQTWEESRGFGWANALHPEDREKILAIWQRACETRSPYESHGRLWHASSQQYRYFEARAAPLPTADGSVQGWVGTCTDVHERKLAEEKLRVSEERFRTLADNISQLAWTCDKLGNVTWYNQRWLDYTGMTFEEMKDWGWAKCHHPDHVDRVVASVQHSRNTGEPWDDTFPLRGKDGNYRWFLSRAIPIRDATGKILRWFGTNTDITEQREIEEELHKLAQDLEKRVAERTRELRQANAALLHDMEERKKLEEQLLQSQKMESIGVLAGGIAHDFNNVLNIIQGYASVLGSDGSQSKLAGESLTVINESIQRGSALVQQLLTLARKSSTQRESVNVNVLIERLTALITQTFPKTIELSTSLEADLPAIAADKNQIEQALLNLCVNARDAMADKGRLTLKTQSVEGATLPELGESREEACVCIEVTDTGTGMEESVRKRIFEPFFTTKDKNQGTGLGLSVVYGIVKNHNGVIDVASKPDHGTTFRMYFPVIAAAARPMTEVVTPVSQETVKERRKSETILLVEDEKRMLYLLEKTLLRQGYRVLTASDGEKALEVYQRHNGTIDAVLLDIGLPKIAGRDVLRQMQKQNPAVRVAIASGYLDPALKSEIYEAGVKHFVDKPYRLDQVVHTLQSLIEHTS